MSYQKTNYVNNSSPKLNAKNLNKTESAIAALSKWNEALCNEESIYFLEQENFELEENSLLAVYFKTVQNGDSKAVLKFNNQIYDLTDGENQLLGNEIEHKSLLFRFDGEKLNLQSNQTQERYDNLNYELQKVKRRYLIDSFDNETGIMWNLYSDGWCEQYLRCTISSVPAHNGVFADPSLPLKLKNTSYQNRAILAYGGYNYASTSHLSKLLNTETCHIDVWNNSASEAKDLTFNIEILGYVDNSVLNSYSL